MPDRTLSYFRTQWLKEVPGYDNLESIVRDLLKKAPNVEDTAVSRANGVVIELRHRKTTPDEPVLLHCASHMPGAEGSIVPLITGKSSAPLETLAPPKNKNFLEGAFAALISGDHCLLCTAGLTSAAVRFFIHMLVKEKKLPKEATHFNLAPVANRDKISEIIESGVAEVGLAATLDELLHARDQAGQSSISYKTKKALQDTTAAIFAKDFDLAKLLKEDLSNINTRLTVSFRKRAKGYLDQESFDDAARHIVEEEEPGIYIRLRSGTIIDAERMKITRRVDIANHGSTIDHKIAWAELTKFYNELKSDKIIK